MRSDSNLLNTNELYFQITIGMGSFYAAGMLDAYSNHASSENALVETQQVTINNQRI
jgi:hypothetical protein